MLISREAWMASKAGDLDQCAVAEKVARWRIIAGTVREERTRLGVSPEWMMKVE